MPHPVDTHVGKRLRHRRWMTGMTQGELADAVGIRFQQIQKYETGANRISASRLWDVADTLGVPISYFFDGLPRRSTQSASDLPGNGFARITGPGCDPKTIVRSFFAMSVDERQRLVDYARSLDKTD